MLFQCKMPKVYALCDLFVKLICFLGTSSRYIVFNIYFFCFKLIIEAHIFLPWIVKKKNIILTSFKTTENIIIQDSRLKQFIHCLCIFIFQKDHISSDKSNVNAGQKLKRYNVNHILCVTHIVKIFNFPFKSPFIIPNAYNNQKIRIFNLGVLELN